MSLDEWAQSGIDPGLRAYVGNLVSALGGTSVEEHGRYVLGDDALACLKDMRRYLKAFEHKQRFDIQRLLAEFNLVKGDLLEILAAWREEQSENRLKSKIALSCLEVLVPLTWPLEIEDQNFTVHHHQHLPYLRLAQVEYKRAILQHDTAEILKTAARIALPAIGIEMKDRTPRDEAIIRLMLYFFRNIASISQPQDLSSDVDEAEISRSATIDAFHRQLGFDVILAISSGMGDQFKMQDVVVLETLFYLLKGIDPERLFLDDEELTTKKDDELRDLMQKEKTLLGSYKRHAPSRHNRFGTMVWMKRDNDKVSTITGQSIISGPDREGLQHMDKSKKWNKPKFKSRSAPEDNAVSEFDKSVPLSAATRRHLRQFVENFLDSSFNPLFVHLRKAIEREAERVLAIHSTQFFYLISWFLQAERARRRRAKQKRDQKGKSKDGAPAPVVDETFGLIAGVLNQETFILMNRYMQRSMDDKNWQQLNACLKCFTKTLLTVQDISESPFEDDQEIAENIQNRVFYEEATHDRIISILRSYKDQGFGYLDACTELAHVFIRMLERYSKDNADMQVRSKQRARKKKQQQDNETGAAPNQDADAEIASEAEELREAEMVSRERKFDFARFQARFMTQACVDTFVAFLKYYNDLSSEQLKRIHRFLYRVAFKNELSVVLFRVDIIRLLHKMIKGPEGLGPEMSCFREWEDLSRHIFRKLIKKLDERPELMVEMLFSKISATSFYLEHGHDKEVPQKTVKPAAEWELKSGVAHEKGTGALVGALTRDGTEGLVEWVKQELERACSERKSWVDAHEARVAIGETDAATVNEVPSFLVKPSSKEVEKAMFKNGKLRLLMSMVGFERLGLDDDPKASYLIRPSVGLNELEDNAKLVAGFINTPQEYDDGKDHDDMVRRKPTNETVPRRKPGLFDDDDDGSENEENSNEDASLYPPGGPTARKSDAIKELKARRRKNRAEVNDEKKAEMAEARRQANLDKMAKIKSDVFVHSSDDDSDEDRDTQFFAMEEKRRTEALSKVGEASKSTDGKRGKRARGDNQQKARKRRKSGSAEEEGTSGRLVEISSDSSSSDGESVEDENTPLSSQPVHAIVNDQGTMAGAETKESADSMHSDDDEDMIGNPVRKVPAPARRNARAGFLIDSDSE